MRKIIFIGFIVLGALIGLFSVIEEDWATRIVMMSVGMLFGAPIGAVLTRIGGKRRRTLQWDATQYVSTGTTPKDLAANYWRDKGYPPFMKPPDAEPDAHMFDPEKLG